MYSFQSHGRLISYLPTRIVDLRSSSSRSTISMVLRFLNLFGGTFHPRWKSPDTHCGNQSCSGARATPRRTCPLQ
jgi:hypothetical protein